jgi:UDP-N-acetylglucosamine--N-acetylmuramyl-(pentapeptide) pyrophosphoryl-undecaprenol N-acetylglucosamine transferase
MRPYKFILSGGGTGGHIYPAIAIANELKFDFQMLNFYLLEPKIKWKCKSPTSRICYKGFMDCGIAASN